MNYTSSQSYHTLNHWQSGVGGDDWYRLPYDKWHNLHFNTIRYKNQYFFGPPSWRESDATKGDGKAYYYNVDDVCKKDNLIQSVVIKLDPLPSEQTETGYYKVELYLKIVQTENIVVPYKVGKTALSSTSCVPLVGADCWWITSRVPDGVHNDHDGNGNYWNLDDKPAYINADTNTSLKVDIDRFTLHITKIDKDAYDASKLDKWHYANTVNDGYRWQKDGVAWTLMEQIALPPIDYKGDAFFRRMPNVHKSSIFLYIEDGDVSGINGIYARYNDITPTSSKTQWQSGDKVVWGEEWDEGMAFGQYGEEYYARYRPMEVYHGLLNSANGFDLIITLGLQHEISEGRYLATIYNRGFGNEGWLTFRCPEKIDCVQERMFIEEGVEL